MKVLFHSDSPAVASGMGRVAFNLGKFFATFSGVEFASIGWHHQGFEKGWKGWKVFPAIKTGPGIDPNQEKEAVERAFNEFEPNLVITLGDIWDFKYMPFFSEAFPLKWLAYYNVDSMPIKRKNVPRLIAPQGLATTSHFGKQALLDADPSLDVDVVWHGYDPDCFYWIPNMSKQRRIEGHGKVLADLTDKFVVFMDSQNTHRKNYPAALAAFEKFAADKKDVYLLLLTQASGTENGFELDYASTFIHKLEGKILICENNLTQGNWISDEELNEFYNLAHVYLSTSRAEGFGLSVLQAFATKTVPLVTNFASYPELIAQGGGMTIEVAEFDVDHNYRRNAIIDTDDCAAKLEFLYKDWQAGEQIARQFHGRGLEFASKNTWAESFQKLGAICDKVTTSPKRIHYPRSNVPYINELRSHAAKTVRKRKTDGDKVGMVVMGGLGDNVQAIPVVKGIARRHPDSNLFLICEANQSIFRSPEGENIYHPHLETHELRGAPFSSILKTAQSAFDYFYDVRYVSRVYAKSGNVDLPPETLEFFKQNRTFYDRWPWANNVIHHLNKHVVDIRLISCGLQHHATLDDMKLPVSEIDLPDKKIVSIHNGAGGIGQLKILPMRELEKVTAWLNAKGFYVLQTGTTQDEKIPGTVDLRGRTDYWQTAYILQRAEIHIGPEGALYHMAKAVGGRSLVWLSVTPPETFTYPDTIILPAQNTREFKCDPCWWKSEDYFHNICALGRETCMNLPTGENIITALEGAGL